MSSLAESTLTKDVVVHVPKKQIVELNSRLKEETRELQHKQLVEILRRITTLEGEVIHLNKLVHARMSDDIEFRSEFDRIVKKIDTTP
jgi:hypothetical protein|tara:strand:- start:529 stop:792 length:264 start_codon:yes stop_codon:yes gene_type:complete